MIFLYFCELLLTSFGWRKRRKKERKRRTKMDIFAPGFLDRTKCHANFEGSFALYKRSSFVWLVLAGPSLTLRARAPIPYVQAAILKLLHPYIRSCYRAPWLKGMCHDIRAIFRFLITWIEIGALFSKFVYKQRRIDVARASALAARRVTPKRAYITVHRPCRCSYRDGER